MYWSVCQSTGADIKKYFTNTNVSYKKSRRHILVKLDEETYNYQLVVTLLAHREVELVAPLC